MNSDARRMLINLYNLIDCCDIAINHLQSVIDSEGKITHHDLIDCQNNEHQLIDSDWLEFAKNELDRYLDTFVFHDDGANI